MARPRVCFMKHFFHRLDDTFTSNKNHHEFLEGLIEELPKDMIYVELGVKLGQSLSYIVVEALNQNKNITAYAIDPWNNEDTYKLFLKNIEPIKDYVTVVKSYSNKEFIKFEDNSIDLLFVDGDHSYEGVYEDCINWYSKVRHIMLFDDINHGKCGRDVITAIKQFSWENYLELIIPIPGNDQWNSRYGYLKKG